MIFKKKLKIVQKELKNKKLKKIILKKNKNRRNEFF